MNDKNSHTFMELKVYKKLSINRGIAWHVVTLHVHSAALLNVTCAALASVKSIAVKCRITR